MLQEAEVTVVSKYLCLGTMLYELGELITDDMICAAGNGTDSCQVKPTVYSAVDDFSFSPPFMGGIMMLLMSALLFMP